MERQALAILAIVTAGAALAIWTLTHLNVRNRSREIGTLRALGLKGSRIGLLFIGKIIAYSIAGACLGSVVGWLAARVLPVANAPVKTPLDVMLIVIVATPIVASIFGLGPIIGGLIREPADLLRRDTV